MKVNFQKILAVVISASVIIFSFASFSVSADETQMTNQEYYAAQSYLIAKYKDGDISYSEFQQQSQAVTDEYVNSNTVGGTLQSGALNASNTASAVAKKIGSTVEKYGEAARERIDGWISDFFDSYTVLSDKPTTDLKGGVCVAKYVSDGGSYVEYYYGYKPGEVYQNGSEKTARIYFNRKEVYIKGVLDRSSDSSAILSFNSERSDYFLYGDWRWLSDGTPAETDDEFETISDYDFTQAPETELEDLLKKILDEFELKQPDLSTLEGLLNAIYARLGTLDSDNDNSLLSEILAAIKAVKNEDTENSDNTDLLDILENLKNALVYDDGENVETIAEQLKKIIDNQITSDDFVIDEDIYNNRGEVLKERLLGKFSFIHNMKAFITYCFEQYSNTSDTPKFEIDYNGHSYKINFDFFNDYMPLVQWILAGFIYISYAYHTYRKIPSYINGGDNE